MKIFCNQHKNDIMLEEADKVYVMWGYLNGIIFGSDYSEDVCSAFLSPSVPPPPSVSGSHTLVTKRKVIKIAFNAPSERKRRGREKQGSRRGRKRVATGTLAVLVLVVVIYMNRGGDVVAITCGVGY